MPAHTESLTPRTYIKEQQVKVKKKGFFYEIHKNRTLYLMFIPVAIYFLVFAYLPMTGIVMAFKEFNYRDGIWFSPWNGVKNFEFFFRSGKAWLVTRNTILYNLTFLACYTFFSMLVAILISEMVGKYFKKLAQSFMFLPYFISWVVVASMVYNFFNYDYGLFNMALKFFGKAPIDIYSNPQHWYVLLPVFYVWKWVGFGSVLYLAAIMGIDQEQYEAATIDGASAFQKIYHITLPALRPTMVILILLGLGRIMRGEFAMFYQLIGNNGLLLNATDIIDTLVFRAVVVTNDFGMAAAAGFYQSVLSFAIIVGANALVRKFEKDYALF
jgi:putative aldouronate transport system permease protein